MNELKPFQASLEQWQAFVAVVDAGGYASAAIQLGKSQSTVSYAIGRLESGLGVRVLEPHGRRTKLSAAGRMLYEQARAAIAQMRRLETFAGELVQGCEAQVRVVADAVFPSRHVFAAVQRLQRELKVPRFEIFDEVLSGTEDLLVRREVDLAILAHVPAGFLGDHLTSIAFVAVASPQHPLARFKQPIESAELRKHRQVVVRDSGRYRRRDSGWLQPNERITVSSFRHSIEALQLGLGFAWIPEAYARTALVNGQLKALQLREGASRLVDTYLVFADRAIAGPATLRLGELLRDESQFVSTPAATHSERG